MEGIGLILLFLLSALLIIPIFDRLNLGAVLGYLVAGILIGPSVLSFVWDPSGLTHLAEFGVIFLLFIIGLELQPSRLWVLRKSIFGMGLGQVLLTTLLISAALLCLGLGIQAAILLGLAVSMSSTALVLQSLAERNQLTAKHGRDSFAILLFQDLAVIPILAIIPLLGNQAIKDQQKVQFWVPIVAIVSVILVGRYLLRPVFKRIASVKSKELFTAASLFIVIATATLMHAVGLSMALGAFLAGMTLADSEYRHEIESNIEPFKGLLLGLFFISIGMSANISLVWEQPLQILGAVVGLYFLKSLALYAIGFLQKMDSSHIRKLAVYMSQGGEFAFVIVGLGATAAVFEKSVAEFVVVVVTTSMILAPFLFSLEDKLLSRILDKKEAPKPYDKIETEATEVVIAGFGRFGQIVARVLAAQKIPFTALEKSSQQVDFVRKFGNRIFYGDATRLELLRAAKVDKAKIFVIAIDDVDDSIKTAGLVRKHFPNVKILARARNRFHAYKLLDLGIKCVERETLLSSMRMATKALGLLGRPEDRAATIVQKFQKYDEELLLRQHAVYQDEALLIQTSKQALADLESLFESDQTVDVEIGQGTLPPEVQT